MGQTILCEILANWEESGEQPDPEKFGFKSILEMFQCARNTMLDLGSSANTHARQAQRLQARIKELETWQTPPYSAAQLAGFEAQGYTPPPQAIPWIHEDVPEIPPTEHRVNVWGCIVREGFEECVRVQYLDINGQQYWQDRNGDGTITVRCFIELPTQAPPKPEGQPPMVDGEVWNLGESEPQKCACGGKLANYDRNMRDVQFFPDCESWLIDIKDGCDPVYPEHFGIECDICVECKRVYNVKVKEW